MGLDCLIGDLIDSSMDVDRMDYLIRDAHMTGLTTGVTNADALIERVTPVKKGEKYLLAYDESAVEYMEHLRYAKRCIVVATSTHENARQSAYLKD